MKRSCVQGPCMGCETVEDTPDQVPICLFQQGSSPAKAGVQAGRRGQVPGDPFTVELAPAFAGEMAVAKGLDRNFAPFP